MKTHQHFKISLAQPYTNLSVIHIYKSFTIAFISIKLKTNFGKLINQIDDLKANVTGCTLLFAEV